MELSGNFRMELLVACGAPRLTLIKKFTLIPIKVNNASYGIQYSTLLASASRLSLNILSSALVLYCFALA
jgi:hypothetical protein